MASKLDRLWICGFELEATLSEGVRTSHKHSILVAVHPFKWFLRCQRHTFAWPGSDEVIFSAAFGPVGFTYRSARFKDTAVDERTTTIARGQEVPRA